MKFIQLLFIAFTLWSVVLASSTLTPAVSINQLLTIQLQMNSATDPAVVELKRAEFDALFQQYLMQHPYQNAQLQSFMNSSGVTGDDVKSLNIQFNYLMVNILGYPVPV